MPKLHVVQRVRRTFFARDIDISGSFPRFKPTDEIHVDRGPIVAGDEVVVWRHDGRKFLAIWEGVSGGVPKLTRIDGLPLAVKSFGIARVVGRSPNSHVERLISSLASMNR